MNGRKILCWILAPALALGLNVAAGRRASRPQSEIQVASPSPYQLQQARVGYVDCAYDYAPRGQPIVRSLRECGEARSRALLLCRRARPASDCEVWLAEVDVKPGRFVPGGPDRHALPPGGAPDEPRRPIGPGGGPNPALLSLIGLGVAVGVAAGVAAWRRAWARLLLYTGLSLAAALLEALVVMTVGWDSDAAAEVVVVALYLVCALPPLVMALLDHAAPRRGDGAIAGASAGLAGFGAWLLELPPSGLALPFIHALGAAAYFAAAGGRRRPSGPPEEAARV